MKKYIIYVLIITIANISTITGQENVSFGKKPTVASIDNIKGDGAIIALAEDDYGDVEFGSWTVVRVNQDGKVIWNTKVDVPDPRGYDTYMRGRYQTVVSPNGEHYYICLKGLASTKAFHFDEKGKSTIINPFLVKAKLPKKAIIEGVYCTNTDLIYVIRDNRSFEDYYIIKMNHESHESQVLNLKVENPSFIAVTNGAESLKPMGVNLNGEIIYTSTTSTKKKFELKIAKVDNNGSVQYKTFFGSPMKDSYTNVELALDGESVFISQTGEETVVISKVKLNGEEIFRAEFIMNELKKYNSKYDSPNVSLFHFSDGSLIYSLDKGKDVFGLKINGETGDELSRKEVEIIKKNRYGSDPNAGVFVIESETNCERIKSLSSKNSEKASALGNVKNGLTLVIANPKTKKAEIFIGK